MQIYIHIRLNCAYYKIVSNVNLKFTCNNYNNNYKNSSGQFASCLAMHGRIEYSQTSLYKIINFPLIRWNTQLKPATYLLGAIKKLN